MASRISTFLRFIKIEHTIFDLPFVFIGLTFAIRITGLNPWLSIKILLIIAEAILARIAGMTLNRILDLPLDRMNPRTQKRELVTGKISLSTAKITVFLSSALFILIAFYLNLLAGFLSPLVLILFFLYPKAKKLPVISHFFMGISIGLIVLAGYIGIMGKFPTTWNLYGYSIFTGLWIATFDVIYQNQDWEFDKEVGIKSIPVLVNGEIFYPVLSLNIITSIFILLSAYNLYSFLAGIIVSIFLIISTFYLRRNDVDTIFRRFYLPVPFIVLVGIII